MGKYFASSEKEKESLREQIKHLHEIVSSKDDRIEKLHEQIKPTIGDKK